MSRGKYLLEITRSERAERPSEDVIVSDSIKHLSGDIENMVQPTGSDTYFVFTGELAEEMVRILASEQFSPYKRSAGEGWRCVYYPYIGTGRETLRSVDIPNPENLEEMITVYEEVKFRIYDG